MRDLTPGGGPGGAVAAMNRGITDVLDAMVPWAEKTAAGGR